MRENRKGILWIGISQFVLLASNFLLLKLLTSELSVYEFGLYSLFMSIVLFSRQILYDPFSIVLAKECASSNNNLQRISDRFRVLRVITDRIGAVFLLLVFLTIVYTKLVNDSFAISLIIVCGLFYIYSYGAQGVYLNVLNSIRDRKPASLFSIFDSVLKIGLVFLAFCFIDKTLIFTLASLSLGSFTVFMLIRASIANKYNPYETTSKRDYTLTKNILMMTMPFYLSTIMVAAKSVGERWILAGFLGVNDLAEYSVLFQIGYAPVLILVGIVQTFIGPKIYGFCALSENNGLEELMRFLYKLLFIILFITCFVCVGAFIFSELVFKLLVGKDYQFLSAFLPFFVLAGSISAIAGIFQVAVIGVFKSRDASKLVVISLLTSVACTALSIILLGFNGAVVGLVISSSATLFIYWLALYRIVFKFSS